MNKTVKSILSYAVVGVVSGATTFGAIKAFDNGNSDNDYSYFAPKDNSGAQFMGINSAAVADDLGAGLCPAWR